MFVASYGRTAYAQNTNATIRGQVLDPSGALVPNARVVIVNKDTGVTVYTGQTESAGAFVAAQVIPGTYKVTVSASGVKDAVIDNLVATVAQVASVSNFSVAGVQNPAPFVKATGVQQELPKPLSGDQIGWAPPYLQRFPNPTWSE